MDERNVIFNNIDKHIMEDVKPSIYLNELKKNDVFKFEYPFSLLYKLTETEQSLKHHPEGSVWNHTMLVVDNAAAKRELSNYPRAFMWSALLHDIGKASTTKLRNGRITSYDHDKVGKEVAEKFLREFTNDEDFIKGVITRVRWHMQILFVLKGLPFADIKGMLSEISLEEISLLMICDRVGRGDMDEEKKLEEERDLKNFIEKCREYVGQ
ncbi:phosphohydrolase [Fervidicella metallireducens AeB]|uniref:Phosphohydrolase n=2 Tax=Fervidicella TaxID=1403538 RepID=A0A017RYA7_9CLOT|nr:HD domain-containing protein [Fervidicella metallireducens]EYE89768.1 phosphohydrolase [Fervidicella metallireducens AeB]